ncbi:hypothetical protein EJB05_27335, partial [Eragrostis curvula]
MCGPAASFLLLIATCCFFLVTHARRQAGQAAARCVPKERDALLDFKHGINDTGHPLASWQRRLDCCSWEGVSCSHRTGNVLKLDLSAVTEDYPYSALGGQLSHSLLHLEHLEYLDLGWFNQTGPNNNNVEFMGSMKNLRQLHLSGSLFSGSIPPQLANLSKLEYLDLSWTSFSGRVPPEIGNISTLQHLDLGNMQDTYSLDISWLTHLHKLAYLDISSVNLTMVASDWPHVLNTLPSLEVLNLGNCALPSTNQTLRHLNLTMIVQLDLSFNYLDRPLESCWFWNITTVESLLLSQTYLYGSFPSTLARLTSLIWLDFSGNANAATMLVDLKDLCALEHLNLDGSLAQGNIKYLVEKLPHATTTHKVNGIGNCSSLYLIDISNNNLTGHIPSSVANISPILTYLDLSGNNLTGVIPQEMGNSTLGYLDLHSNRLSGQIHVIPRNLNFLDISSNFLSGPLPSHFGAPNLQDLILSTNLITGRVPQSICELHNLAFLDLANNFLEGAFPQCFGMSGLVFLQLSNNSLSDIFPSFLQRCSNLAFLDLSWNKFYGTLPLWIGEMMNMQFLLLSHNLFCGHIPIKITNLRQLRHLNLASNNISGAIPWSLSNLMVMSNGHRNEEGINLPIFYRGVVLNGFSESLLVVIKRQVLKYGASFFYLVSIDISKNHLTGGIPDQITSLNGLLNLNLSSNHLTGSIPKKIGDMKSVESLDLSRNNLYGQIPPSLSDLTYLCDMDLSYNNLIGRIPPGRQLDTLYTENPSMYDGNHGLCGPPLQRNCSSCGNSGEKGNQTTSERDSETIFFYFGLGSGFTVGLWVAFCTLLFKKTWRIRYYRLFDRAYDSVFVFVVVTWLRLARQATGLVDAATGLVQRSANN